MRVLINGLQAGNRSGTGRYTLELVQALAALPDAPELVLVWPKDIPPPEVGHSVEVRRYSAREANRLCFDQFGIGRLREQCRADVLHYPANIGPLARQRGVVLTVHDLSFMHHPEWFRTGRALYYRQAARRSIRRATRIIADSEATAEDVVRFTDTPRDRIDVVPLGVSPIFQPASGQARAAVRAKYGLPERFFLYVGTLEPRKNLPRLVAAWSRVADDIPQDLVLAGRRGWKTRAIEKALADSPHAARVHRPGFIAQEDLPAALSAADAFVWPSLFEGFGLPPLEAMACGAPVLTSAVSSLPEVAGGAALLVEPEDVDALAQALHALATDPAKRAILCQAGERRAQAFTWARTAAWTAQSYARAAEEASA